MCLCAYTSEKNLKDFYNNENPINISSLVAPQEFIQYKEQDAFREKRILNQL